MIDARELRIGNWVGYKDHQIKIDGINYFPNDKYKCVYGGNEKKNGSISGQFTFEEINPIPITPDVLEKLGFHKHNNAWVTEDYDERNYTKDYFTIWNLHEREYKLNTTQFAIPITSLHQLMNLYQSLTGTELTYNQ